MAIGPVPPLEELIDIIADDHPWILILITVLTASLVGIGFYLYFWPIISGQPEYSSTPIFQTSGIAYDVYVMKPDRVEPDGETEYEFRIEIEQNSVLSTTQRITLTVKSLSPFIRFVSDSLNDFTDTKSFSVAPLTSEPQRFSHSVSFVVFRPVDRARFLPLEVILRYGQTTWKQEVDLKVDYFSRLIVYLATGGTFTAFVAFAIRVVRSLIGR